VRAQDLAVQIRKLRRPKKTQGRCYELSGQIVCRADKAMALALVHGEVSRKIGKRIGHAWVEKGNLVYDVVLDQFFSVSHYYEKFGVKVVSRYFWQEAAKQVIRFKHWGPWENVMGVEHVSTGSGKLAVTTRRYKGL